MAQKLLLADDSITIRRVVELTFSGEDMQVVAVSDGEQAIARIPIERPDIVLADIGMPKRSGYDVSAFVKGHPDLAHIPVLLLAGAFEPVDEARAAEVKCDGVLVKPFEPQQVIARVRELVDGAKGSPTRASAGVPRPVERLLQAGARRSEPRVPGPEARVTSTDPAAASPDLTISTAGAPARTADPTASLDDYFDRLDAAFATLSNTQSDAAGDDTTMTGRIDAAAARPEVPTVDDVLAGAAHLLSPAGPATPLGRVAPPPVEPPDTSPALTPAARPAVTAPDARDQESSFDALEEFSVDGEQGRTSDTLGVTLSKVDGAGQREPGRGMQGEGAKTIADAFTALFAVEQGEPGATPVRFSLPSPPLVVTDELVDKVTRRVLERLAPNTARDLVADIVSEVAERLVREEIARIRRG